MPGEEEPVPKVSFVKLYAPWGWIAGSGLYLDDVSAHSPRPGRCSSARFTLRGRAPPLDRVLHRPPLGPRARSGRSRRRRGGSPTRSRAARSRRGPIPTPSGPTFRPMIEGINATMESFQLPFTQTLEAVTALARGEMPPPIERDCVGECAQLRDGLNRAIGTVSALVHGVQRLADAAQRGHLDARIEPSLHQGEFRKVAEGLNATLDGIIRAAARGRGADRPDRAGRAPARHRQALAGRLRAAAAQPRRARRDDRRRGARAWRR